MKKKFTNILRNQTILWIVLSITLTFLVTSLTLISQSHALLSQNYKDIITLESERKNLELNYFFNSAENLAKQYYSYILENLDEKKLLTDSEYEKQFMLELTKLMSSSAVSQKGLVSTFFRLEMEQFGPNRGIFLIGGYQKSFVSVRTTDLSKYSPTDSEHVGWYYLPIWNKSPVWTISYENKNLRQKTISYSIPVYKNEKLLGIVGIDLSLGIVEELVNSIHIDNALGLLIGKEQNLIQLNKEENLLNEVECSAELTAIIESFKEATNTIIKKIYWNEQYYSGTLKQLDNGMMYIIAVAYNEIMQLVYKELSALIISFIIAASLSVILIIFILHKIMIPIKIVSRTTNRLARGELYIDIPYESHNEIGILANNIRMMTSQMKEYIEYISEQTKKEREAKEAALNESQINAAASQAKSAFLANMSHEIRTPINAVLGMNEMILRESKDKTILGYSTNIKIAGANLLSIVNDVLDFSKIEAGKMELLPDNYEVSSLVIDLVNMTRERAQSKGLKYELNINPTLPKTLCGDSVRIKQCILNLLTNAIKYTKKGLIQFLIDYEKVNDNTLLLTVHVKDTGCGIKKDDMEKLFAPFERIDEEKNRTIEGSGLGMSIVRRLLDMMHSKLNVQSIYGKGSDFSFTIEQQVIDWTASGDLNEAYEESINLMANYKEKLYAPDAHLLFVDDTAMNLEVIKGLLKNTGIKIDTVLSGKEALEAVKNNKYDILFIDHRMPEMDGIQTLHAIKELKDNLSTGKPCIALTANAISGVKKMYINEGFDDYLSKPVNPAKLEEIITNYLPAEYLKESTQETNNQAEKASDFIIKLKKIKGIDASTALTNCGSEELLLSTIKQYHSSIDQKALELQQFFENEEWDNYGIKVHALKSTSRLIGAIELSNLAEHLEECTNNNTVSEIQENHKHLIDTFLSFKHLLEPLIKNDSEEKDKPEITKEELADKVNQLVEYADAFDIDGLDMLISDLSSYKLPLDFSEKFDNIRTFVENVDFKNLRILLSEGSNN